jgi:hypothetical protein
VECVSSLAPSQTIHILDNFLVPCDFLVTIIQEVCRAQEEFPHMGLVWEGSRGDVGLSGKGRQLVPPSDTSAATSARLKPGYVVHVYVCNE